LLFCIIGTAAVLLQLADRLTHCYFVALAVAEMAMARNTSQPRPVKLQPCLLVSHVSRLLLLLPSLRQLHKDVGDIEQVSLSRSCALASLRHHCSSTSCDLRASLQNRLDSCFVA
jgi:hypothetical protein